MHRGDEGQPTLGTSRDKGLNRVPLDGPPTCQTSSQYSSIAIALDTKSLQSYQDHSLGGGQVGFADRDVEHGDRGWILI